MPELCPISSPEAQRPEAYDVMYPRSA